MKKVISFSLWGDSEGYLVGGIVNADIAMEMWPDWICRFYIASDVPECVVKELKKRNNVEVILMNRTEGWNGMFWRFYSCSDPEVDVMISRDVDSRLNIRDKAAVDEWLESDKDFHIMRDHPWHGTEILGGMWGAKRGVLNQMQTLMDNYDKGNFWQVDQNFLKEKVYALVVNNSIVHDEFFNYESFKKPFPCPRKNFEFVGEIINEVEEFIPENREVIKKHLNATNK